MKKMICALLALVLALSLVPMTALAAEELTAEVTVKVYYAKDYESEYKVTVGSEPVTLTADRYEKVDGRLYNFHKFSNNQKTITIPAYDGSAAWHKEWDEIEQYYVRHTHSYVTKYNRHQHWDLCDCGHITGRAKHMDPAGLKEKVCSCGYKFSSNCDLTTLWLKDMNLTERFNRETTDYTALVYAYKNVDKTSISAKSFDALATVELPEDLTLGDGLNTFEITVTAEDKEHTKTYTVVAVKPAKVGGLTVISDGETVTAEPKTKTAKRLTTATIPETLLAEMAEMAARDGDAQIVLKPSFSKWGCDRIEIPMACAELKDIQDAELVIETHFGSVTIPAAELEGLMGDGEILTVSIAKEDSIQLLLDGTAITELPKAVDCQLY